MEPDIKEQMKNISSKALGEGALMENRHKDACLKSYMIFYSINWKYFKKYIISNFKNMKKFLQIF